MARKKPSCHSDQQFALFLKKTKGMVDAGQHGPFEATVRSLILRIGKLDRPAARNGSDESTINLPPKPDFAAIESAACSVTSCETSRASTTAKAVQTADDVALRSI
jgi:hypothetical protein